MAVTTAHSSQHVAGYAAVLHMAPAGCPVEPLGANLTSSAGGGTPLQDLEHAATGDVRASGAAAHLSRKDADGQVHCEGSGADAAGAGVCAPQGPPSAEACTPQDAPAEGAPNADAHSQALQEALSQAGLFPDISGAQEASLPVAAGSRGRNRRQELWSGGPGSWTGKPFGGCRVGAYRKQRL